MAGVIQKGSLFISLIVVFAVVVEYCITPGAATAEEPMDLQQKDYNPSFLIPYGYVPFSAYSYPSLADKISMFRAMAYGGRGFHKRFDSLSGNTFGAQKRSIAPYDY